jgi:hypothetical protein
MNLGEAYLDHYERFLRRGPAERWAFGAGGPTLQVLAYDGIFKGCRLFGQVRICGRPGGQPPGRPGGQEYPRCVPSGNPFVGTWPART